MSNLSKKILSIGTLVVGLGTTALTYGASFTGTLTNVLSEGGTTAADTLNNQAFSGITNLIYSMITYAVEFFFQSTVLAVVIALIVISLIAGRAWAYVKKRAMGGRKR